MSWWGLLSIWSTVLAAPFAGTSQPLTLPLPQTIDYATYMRGQLLASNFSTDPTTSTSQPRVAAEAGSVQLEAFIINYEPCVLARDVVAYRLVVRNVSDAQLSGVTAQFTYPAQVLDYKESTSSPPTGVTSGDGTLTWNIGTILPGRANWHELNITFVAKTDGGVLSTELTVSGGDNLVLTGHTIPDTCPAQPFVSDRPAAPKSPAIICDRGEIGCAESIPSLGALFNEVFTTPARQPTVCSPEDPDGCTQNRPRLGVRFDEAVASLLPGECSVLADSVLAEPEFHDGLLRRADVAALFMRPLYDSGQDYSRLVLENQLLGITNKLHAKNVLSAIHTKHWRLRIEPLESVLRGTLATNVIRARIDQWNLDWITETREAQKDLEQRYQALQTARGLRFDPVAAKGVVNAKESIERACGHIAPPAPADGGLSPLLFEGQTSVKNIYLQTLLQRGGAYAATQNLFADPNNNNLGQEFRATTWQAELRAALDAFDNKNDKPLREFVAQIPRKDRRGFEAGWQASYEKHAADDVTADDTVRLANWEIALDTPKTVAAACARDTTLAAEVEVSWCESGLYAEYILNEALEWPTVKDTAPPPLVVGGEATPIDPLRTFGTSCGRFPGDPYWAADCSCNCQQLVAGQDPGAQIKFCQAGKPLEEPPPIPSQPPVSCAPLVCPSGDTFPSCDLLGRPISYPFDPCQGRPIPTFSSEPLPTREAPSFGAQFNAPFPRPAPAPPNDTPSQPVPQPGPGGGKPIIRPDKYSIAQAPSTQDECLQERNVRIPPEFDDHFLTNPS